MSSSMLHLRFDAVLSLMGVLDLLLCQNLLPHNIVLQHVYHGVHEMLFASK